MPELDELIRDRIRRLRVDFTDNEIVAKLLCPLEQVCVKPSPQAMPPLIFGNDDAIDVPESFEVLHFPTKLPVAFGYEHSRLKAECFPAMQRRRMICMAGLMINRSYKDRIRLGRILTQSYLKIASY